MAQRLRWLRSDALDDLFLKHYAALVARAELLTRGDRQSAEDLVHDAYVRLALRGFDASGVHNVEAYLFMTLRNVHLSHVRRRQATVTATVSIVDHESAAASLRSAATGEERVRAYEALGEIVRYACLRKATSTSASVLILRFFHGYYAGEIARVVRASEAAVAERLRMARAEVRAYLDDPSRVRGIGDRRPARPFTEDAASLSALQQMIFDACAGTCLTPRALDRLYASRWPDALDAPTLAHLVSCATCLDVVNLRLGLPLLADRDPSDRLGRGGPSHGAGGSGTRGDTAAAFRARLEQARSDYPQELRMAINGLVVSAQAVHGHVTEQRLKLLVPEQLGFVEVFDERDTCLLYLDIEPPPHGPVEQSALVALSDGRQLSARVTFADAAPTLHVVYDNPAAADDRHLAIPERAVVKAWNVWPLALRFVIAGIILGVLLANPRQTLAAVEHVRRAIVDSIVELIERVRPREALSSRALTPTAELMPFAAPVLRVMPAPAGVSPTLEEGLNGVALTEVAVEALRLLDRADALTREQIGVTKGVDRRLHVQGIVDSHPRRQELASLLGTLPPRSVQIELLTLEEVAKQSSALASPPTLLRSADLARDREPIGFAALRRYLSDRTDDQIPPVAASATDEAVRRFSRDLLAWALEARLRSRLVQELVAVVSAEEAEQLSASASATWHQLVRRHAERVRHDTTSLRRALEQIFSMADEIDAPIASPHAQDVWARADRLFAIASAHDVGVRRAFTVGTDGRASLDVSTDAFRRSLLEAEQLADALATAPAGGTRQ